MIVILVAAIRSDERGGADEHFPRRVTGLHGLLEPRLLFRAPDGLFGSVRHVVGRAMIASVRKPDLQVAAPTEGTIARTAHRRLLFEYLLTFREGEDPRLGARPGVIF